MEHRPVKVVMRNERLITPSGLLFIGQLLDKTTLKHRVNRITKTKKKRDTKKPDYSNYDCIATYISLLCQGKTDCDSARELQEDIPFYVDMLGLNGVPSAETLRQRLDELGFDLSALDLIMEESAKMLVGAGAHPTPLYTGHVPIDVDVSPHDNSNTKKEGVGRTYKGFDGYAPIYAYIGTEGYACNASLRYGRCHCQDGTEWFLEDTLEMARTITKDKLLVRMDSGNDSLDNIKLFIKEGVDYIIARNRRKETLGSWLDAAMGGPNAIAIKPREGKTVYIGSTERARDGVENPIRVVYEVTVRTIKANGQVYIEPDIEVETWWTSLPDPVEEIIQLYHEHAICEQFHSEIKSDIGLERFPSGKFETNSAILKLAALALNILRVVGSIALGDDAKLTKNVVMRLRAKTVMKRLIFIASHITTHARRLFMSLGRSNIWRAAFAKVHDALA